LLKARRALPEPEVRYFIRQLMEGCKHIHLNRVVHRDIKLGNLLLDANMELKICDFGLATRMRFESEKKQ
jgi:serine/threonine protein kinase